MISAISSVGSSYNSLIAAATGSVAAPQRTYGLSVYRCPDCTANISPDFAGKSELTDEEKQRVDELRRKDAEVRRHEQAHKAAAGPYAQAGPVYKYQIGPDGRPYAVEGRVDVDLSPIPGDPQATIDKMRRIQRAASAPANPSAADRQVAAQAATLEGQAQAELARQTDAPTGAGAAHPSTDPPTVSQPPLAGGPGRFIDVRA
jgi:hypothetical protein